MGIRKFVVGALAFILLIWGPIDHSSPYGLWLRVTYLIAVPGLAWIALDWVWRYWRPNRLAEDRLMRTVAGMVACAFFIAAISAARRDYHVECTQEVQNWDGRECVGDYIRVPGPDLGAAVMLAGGGVLAIWFGISASKAKQE